MLTTIKLKHNHRFIVSPPKEFPYPAYMICRFKLPVFNFHSQHLRNGIFLVECYETQLIPSYEQHNALIELARHEFEPPLMFTIKYLTEIGEVMQTWEVSVHGIRDIDFGGGNWSSDEPELTKINFSASNCVRTF